MNEPLVFTIAAPQSLQLDDLAVEDGAIVDDNRVVLVGTVRDRVGMTPPDHLAPNGAIVDLSNSTSKPFTNGHTTWISTVAVGRGRVVTTGDRQDEFIRVWDLAKDAQAEPVRIEPESNEGGTRYGDYSVTLFPKSDRAAVWIEDKIHIIDLTDPSKRRTLDYPENNRRWASGPFIISPDERTIACCTGPIHELVCWDIKSRKRTQRPMPLKGEQLPEWHLKNTNGFHQESFLNPVQFLDHKTVLLFRSHMKLLDQKFPETLDEAAVDPTQRSTLTVGLPGWQVEHLGMGRADYAFSCALDPSQTWLAIVGNSPADQPAAGTSDRRGELRVYHFPTRRLVHREQTAEDHRLTWVGFTPSGKRLVAVSAVGLVRWWDVAPSKAP